MAVAPGYARGVAAPGYVNRNNHNDNNPNRINTADDRFIIQENQPTDIYGVSDVTLKLIIEHIKLKILQNMGHPGVLLPATREQFITAVTNSCNLIINGEAELKALRDRLNANIRLRLPIDASTTPFVRDYMTNPRNNHITNYLIADAHLDSRGNPINNNIARAPIMPNIGVIHEEGNGLNTSILEDANRIQNRLDNCYILESFYLRKHNELIDMFKFAILLYNKFNYTLQTLLYVLSLLTQHTCVGNPINPQNLIKLPRKIIPNIKKLIEEQHEMRATIDGVRHRINIPIDTTDDGVSSIRGLDPLADNGIRNMFAGPGAPGGVVPGGVHLDAAARRHPAAPPIWHGPGPGAGAPLGASRIPIRVVPGASPIRGGGRKSPMNRKGLRDKDNQNIHHEDEYEDDYEDNH